MNGIFNVAKLTVQIVIGTIVGLKASELIIRGAKRAKDNILESAANVVENETNVTESVES